MELNCRDIHSEKVEVPKKFTAKIKARKRG